jgi:hypothetical protein
VLATVIRAEPVGLKPLAAPALWQTAEFRVEHGPDARNPFDSEELTLDAIVTLPSGRQLIVPAFWYQEFSRALAGGKEVLTKVGRPEWRVRFTPTEAGVYHVTLTLRRGATDPEEMAKSVFSVDTASAAPGPRGWVTIGTDRRTLATTDGQTLRLSGENICWPHERGTFDYDEWFDAMRRSGQNVARLWLCPWWAPLEHVPGTLNNYRLDAAWEIDQIFRAATERGIYLVLCFDHHGMFQEDNQNWGGTNNFWKTNPYNAAIGGPCSSPNDFFVNPRARTIYEKRLRYLIGRYGSSPYLLAWELFNEIDNVYGPLHGDDVVAWHRDIGQWLHAHDPFRHLVTTSLTGGSDRAELWQIPELDFACYHSYADMAPARFLAELSRRDTERYGKPMWIGEFGTSARAWEMAGDPYLRGLRQGLWGGALGGSVGTSAPWWWEDIHATNAYPLWTHLNDVLRRAGVVPTGPAGASAGPWRPIDFVSVGAPPADLGPIAADRRLFDTDVPLGGAYRSGGDNVAAIVDWLTGARTAEELNHYLRPAGTHPLAKSLQIHARFGDGAKLIVHVDSVSNYAELVVRADGREVGRTPLPDRDGKSRPAKEYDADFTYDLPAGEYTLVLDNVGKDWVYLDHLRLQHVLHSSLAGGWTYQPEPIGLRQQDRAVLYVVSPWTPWPASAKMPVPPTMTDTSVTLRAWPAGEYQVEWIDPATGTQVGVLPAKRDGDNLVLSLPAFNDDLAGIVTRKP